MKGFSFSLVSISIVIFLFIFDLSECLIYTPKYQPELDQLSLDKYMRDEYLFRMHVNCLLYDGPCDPVGRWMKPRMASYLLSSCVLCTPNQEREGEKFFSWLYQNHPQLFRLAVEKYLAANGISLPKDSKYREGIRKMSVPQVGGERDSSSEEKNARKGLHGHNSNSDEIMEQSEQENGKTGQVESRLVDQDQGDGTEGNPGSRENKEGKDSNAAERKTKWNFANQGELEDDEAELDTMIFKKV